MTCFCHWIRATYVENCTSQTASLRQWVGTFTVYTAERGIKLICQTGFRSNFIFGHIKEEDSFFLTDVSAVCH